MALRRGECPDWGGDLNLAGTTALPLRAANGDISTPKALLYPQRTLVPEKNPGRVQAILGEECQKKAKIPAELALDNNFSDVYYLFGNPAP